MQLSAQHRDRVEKQFCFWKPPDAFCAHRKKPRVLAAATRTDVACRLGRSFPERAAQLGKPPLQLGN
jgi:hypothetical protein